MTHGTITVLNLASVGLATLGGLFLYWGGLTVPWKLRSWSGETEAEKRYERTQHLMAWLGIPSVILAGLFQVIVILGSSN